MIDDNHWRIRAPGRGKYGFPAGGNRPGREADMSYDVIVAGGGPAGSGLAVFLAGAGMKVLLLEKSRYPRFKPCGGALSPRVAELLDFPWREIVRDTAGRVDCHLGPGRRVSVEYGEPVAYLVERDDLDSLLARRAAALGAEVREDSPVTGVELAAEGVTVATGTGKYRGGLLACADGVHSLAARRTGLYGSRRLGVTLAAELVPKDPERFRGRMVIDLGACRGGYGWIFPKGDRLSVGLGSFGRVADLRSLLSAFLAGHGLGDHTVARQRGHLIPADGNLKRIVARGRVFLLGDAAALVDPFTGEGIYYAVLSARLAARAILAGDGEAAASYQQLVDGQIRRNLATAGRIARLFYALPAPFFALVERHPELAESVIRAAYGATGYASLAWGRAGFRRIWRKAFGHPVSREP